MKLHHVGVAVRDLNAGISHYQALGMTMAHRETVPAQKVEVAFMGSGPWIELVAGLGPDSPVSKFIDKRGEGQHHVAYAVKSIAVELEKEAKAGRKPIDAAARPGAWGHKVAFLHPKDHSGVLIELVEEGH
ncbi:MAG: methylmalonyl-CoA epimerase [Elusimicrobiota bacterium]|nr:MAG: methylmalonyl-CoA epimerase [Elusimicrobiota bacterium]